MMNLFLSDTPYFKIPKVVVRFERNGHGFLKARVVQDSADGPVEGKNMLKGMEITGVGTAKTEVQAQIGGMVGEIEWDECE